MRSRPKPDKTKRGGATRDKHVGDYAEKHRLWVRGFERKNKLRVRTEEEMRALREKKKPLTGQTI